ncbi:MAG: family 78 glycoside hydrolase catalytic domain [Chryseolinea sp.]
MRLLLLIFMFAAAHAQTGSLIPESLTCEYMSSPSVVDVLQPRLAWINRATSRKRGQKQTAWQVQVSSSESGLSNPDLWDSGKTPTDQNDRIVYAGKPMTSRMECWWSVRVWDDEGKVSEWSKPSQWRMGLLNRSDWKAKWIGAPWQGEDALPKPRSPTERGQSGPPAPLLRKTFNVTKPIARAVAFVTGLGYFEMYANGSKVGTDVLVPNQTNYDKRPDLPNAYIPVDDNFTRYKVLYLAYDIKPMLKQGENVIGGIIGNGFYNPAKYWAEGYGTPRFLTQVYITYTDGTEDVVVSDETWKASESPIIMDMVYYGETYDATREQAGWSSPGFNDSSWKNVAMRRPPAGELAAHTANTDKVTQALKPVSIEKLANGNYKVDFGVEISGWVRFNNIDGPKGDTVSIAFNGNEFSGSNRFIFSGNGPQNYAPRFNWFVFSAIEIKNWPGELTASQLTAEAVNTYVEASATFETSNKLFNDINKIWRRSQVDNMHGGVASDCPHRERSAYTGDGQVACATVMQNYDVKNFYHKWIQDIHDAQDKKTGYVPNAAPWQPGCGGGVAWGAAICIMPWEFYAQYGAVDMLKDNYESMKGYVRYMKTWVDNDGIMFSKRQNKDGVLQWFNLGEWVAPGEKIPDDLVHTFYFWQCADLTSKTAGVLGNKEDAIEYAALAEKTRKAFYKRFFNPTTGSYGNGGGDVLALYMGVPEIQQRKVRTALAHNIATHNGHLDTGIFGTRYFFEVLANNGMNDLAYAALNKTTMPSFGHWVEIGSTTTREEWNEDGSHNHPMFGGGLVWFYRNLAGMKYDERMPGYKHIVFKPQPVPDLQFVTYTRETIFGEAGIHWEQKDKALSMDITVPVGATATVYVPAISEKKVMESNKRAKLGEGIKFKALEGGYAVYEIVSGAYHFSVLK